MMRLLAALQFLTRLPVPRVAVGRDAFAGSMPWFPVAGLAIGGLLAFDAWAAARLDPWIAAMAVLAIWVWSTGALHLDGLGDLADAGGAAHKGPERVRAVLADPHIGSFGVVAIVLQLLAKLVLLHALIPAHAFAGLLLVPVIARIGPIAWTLVLPPLYEGLGSLFRAALRPWHLLLWSAAWLGLCWWVPPLLVAPLLIGGWAWRLRVTLGGISGDGHGAGIEMVETGLLAALALWPVL